jgi:hypothetical protein
MIGPLKLNQYEDSEIYSVLYLNMKDNEGLNSPYIVYGGTDGLVKIFDIKKQKVIFKEKD